MGLTFDKNMARALELRLTQTGDRAVKGISDVMREGAEEIQKLAQDYAPYAPPELGGSEVEREHLQAAIEIAEDRGGVNRRLQMTVFVNGRRHGKGGKLIGSYAFLMHELLSPYGAPVFQARAGTLAKGRAGGKFLERAYRDTYKKILTAAREKVAAALR
jgi:hypothetical protein